MDYDIVLVGGGLGGSALAKAMAERGARILVLEREKQFRDWTGCGSELDLNLRDPSLPRLSVSVERSLILRRKTQREREAICCGSKRRLLLSLFDRPIRSTGGL